MIPTKGAGKFSEIRGALGEAHASSGSLSVCLSFHLLSSLPSHSFILFSLWSLSLPSTASLWLLSPLLVPSLSFHLVLYLIASVYLPFLFSHATGLQWSLVVLPFCILTDVVSVINKFVSLFRFHIVGCYVKATVLSGTCTANGFGLKECLDQIP